MTNNSRTTKVKTTFLIGIISIIVSCCQSNRHAIYPIKASELLTYLGDETWYLCKVCIDGVCQDVEESDSQVGIVTSWAYANMCTDEKGDFYIFGKYVYIFDPETYELKKVVSSCPSYFKICGFCPNRNEIKIKLCTLSGYYSGKMKIIDESTIEITINRPENENKKVVQVYKRR